MTEREAIPPDIALDRLPGPRRQDWPAGFFRDEVAWSPSRTYFALAYSICEASMNNDVGCVLWGMQRDGHSEVLGNPDHVLASCWEAPWAKWLDEETFVFKAQSGSGKDIRLPLVIVSVNRGFALLPDSDNTGSSPARVAVVPPGIQWRNLRELAPAVSGHRLQWFLTFMRFLARFR